MLGFVILLIGCGMVVAPEASTRSLEGWFYIANTLEFLNRTYAVNESLPKSEQDYGDEFCRETLPARCPFLRSSSAIPSESGVVAIQVTSRLERILAIDDARQMASMMVRFQTTWRLPYCATWKTKPAKWPVDQNSSWSPDFHWCPYDNKTIWTPKYQYDNPLVQVNELDRYDSYIRLYSAGGIQMNQIYVIDLPCTFYFERFPFDIQTCTVKATISTLAVKFRFVEDSSDSITGQWKSNVTRSGDERPLDAHSIWRLELFRVSTRNIGTGNEQELEISFTVSRKSQLYVCKIFVPTILLAIMQMAALLLPPDTIDRAAFSASIFLSMAVFQGPLIEGLPQTSEVLVLTVYYTIEMAVGALITVYSCAVCRMMAKAKFLDFNVISQGGIVVCIVDILDFAVFLGALSAFIYANIIYF